MNDTPSKLLWFYYCLIELFTKPSVFYPAGGLGLLALPENGFVPPPPRDRFRIPGRKNLDKTLKTVNMIVSNNIEICIPFVENISI
jgi:hypothetical protein